MKVSNFRELEKYNLPILLALFFPNFVIKPRRCPASPTFSALLEKKIASQNLGSLFISNSLNKTTLLLVLLLGTVVTFTQAATPFGKKEYTKKIEKTFDITANGKVNLNNRYGQVTVMTWDKNKVEIEVTIKVNSRGEDDAEETFDRIKIEFSNTDSYVSAITQIESSSSSNSWLSWLGDVSNDDFSIHYLVHMPASNDLALENKYGNSSVEDLKGDAMMTINYGNVDMKSVGGDLTLDLGYGNATVGNSGNADVNIKYSNLKMNRAKDIRIDSKYSKIKIEEAVHIRSQSKYDGYNLGRIKSFQNIGKYDHFEIEHLEELQIETKYSDVSIDNLQQSVDALMSHGGMSIKSVSAGFKNLRLEGKYTNFKLGVSGNFTLDAQASYGDIHYPGGMEISIDKQKSNNHEIQGHRGSKNAGMIKARLEYGNLKVY